MSFIYPYPVASVRQFRWFVILLLASLIWPLAAQDIHFSQYYLSPLSLNPAHTGDSRGDFRGFANYRTQWREINDAYNTFSAGGDINFYPAGHNVSAGLLAVRDQSGGDLLVTKILPSGAIHRSLGGFNLHAGVQPGVVMKTIDFYSNSFPEQLNWQTGEFDPGLPNSEVNLSQRFTYFDLNAGIGLSRRFGRLEPVLGVAAFHINKPKESFFENANRLPLRMAYNAAVSYTMSNLVVHVHSLYGFTDLVSDWVSGINLEYVLSRDFFFHNSLFAGFMWRDGFKRNPDASIVTAGINFQNYTLGFSYDITFSQLRSTVNGKGAFELALIYRSRSSRMKKTIVPCERY